MGELNTNSGATAPNQTAGNTSLASILSAVQGATPAGNNNIGDVDIASLPKSSTANTPSIATGATALAANANRKLWSIQNVGTNPLFVRLGSGASTTAFHFVLKGGSADSDGNGATLADEYYTGIVTIDGTSPKYVVTELT